jgi:hypothetical protein
MLPPKPFLGSKAWAIVLCKFSDQTAEPYGIPFYNNWITRGNKGINDYFHDVSYGNCNLDGSKVFGWFELPYTKAEDTTNHRLDRITKAAMVAQSQVDFTKFYGICIILNAQQDTGSIIPPTTLTFNGKSQQYALTVLDPLGIQLDVSCHEFGHGFYLNHSRNTINPTKDYGNPFDVMSAMRTYSFTDTRYDYPGNTSDQCGPGLNSPNLDSFGWIDSKRIYNINQSWSLALNAETGNVKLQTFTMQLSALSHPETNQYLCATLQCNLLAAGAITYYFEYRTADGWDAGMANHGFQDCVLIEEERSDDYNYLVYPTPSSNCLQVGQSYLDAVNNITVKFLSVSSHVATLQFTLPVYVHLGGNLGGVLNHPIVLEGAGGITKVLAGDISPTQIFK